MSKKKSEQLGMPFGTACNRLRKMVMFSLLRRVKEDFCFRCGERIEDVSDLSLEHKVAWQDEQASLFWELTNIAFSHLSCNSRAGKRSPIKHGTRNGYRRGCKCNMCRGKVAARRRIQRARKKSPSSNR